VGLDEENMKTSDASQGQSVSDLISQRIAERWETLSRMRKLIKQTDPDIVEEWKWRGEVARLKLRLGVSR
jgi:hypothetical protein